MSSDAHLNLLKLMIDGGWRTRVEIGDVVPQAEVTRRLRDLRKPEHGNYTVAYDPKKGYRIIDPAGFHPDERVRKRRLYLEEQCKK